jgi:2-keto-4-pentenoate hydratase/2-oxohepta-3-ene-1,7-dioic acid hydratase in catechol pathway
MKLATFNYRGRRFLGRVSTRTQTVVPLRMAADERGLTPLIEAMVQGKLGFPGEDVPLPLAEVCLEAPLPRPRRNVFCIGLNYRSHAAELAARGFNGAKSAEDLIPAAPVVFSKVPESVIGPGQPIVIPAASRAIDYEAELAVVIGRGGRAIPRAQALEHVFGYTIVNDVTARDMQKRHQQWLLGKSCDSFCPMGPWIVTTEEIDGSDLGVKLWVDGELRQAGRSSDLVFDIPAIIEALSAAMTLYPGDVIATGTPAGVGMASDPPRWLTAGNTVKVEIEGIGVLENPVR